ncbi:DNA translocase FtsK [Xanthobacter sediminis]
MSSSNQPPRMVNFPSLLVTEGEEAGALGKPGEPTVHSWINADFVPSWLRSFTLDQNTRFTRTPDHLLRPPEEPHAEALPSYGTEGASWHFLEMPLDIRDDVPPVPSVKADIAALEQAFADLPALRAARESAHGDDAETAFGPPSGAEGWSVDEHGVETVLSWHAEPEHCDAEAGMDADAPGAIEPPAAAARARTPVAPLPSAFDAVDLAPDSFSVAAGAAGDAGAEAPSAPDGPAAPAAPALHEDGPYTDAMAAITSPLTEPVVADTLTAYSVPTCDAFCDDTRPGAAPETAAAETARIDSVMTAQPLAGTADAATDSFAPWSVETDTIPPATSENAAPITEATLLAPDHDAAAESRMDAERHDLDGASGDTESAEAVLTEACPEGPALGATALAEADTALDDGFAETDGAADLRDGAPLDGAHLDDTLAQLAAAALDDATARLEAAAPAAAVMEDLAPAHLRPLTRLIVVGRLALPEVEEQDLAPSAPEAGTAARAASRITAHFAWQPYHLNIRTEVPPPSGARTGTGPEAASTGTASTEEASATAAETGTDEAAPDAAAPEEAYDPFAYHLPPIDLLREPPHVEPDFELSEEFLDQSSAMLQQILRDFGIRGEVIDANPGPVVTLYEFEPAPGVKSSRVIALAADIARSMSAVSARVAVVEGRNVIGIELPNRRRDTVWLRELLASHEFEEARTKLGLCLGKTIGGVPVIADLARMPHLLVAGTTGSGKSVAINTMILSLLYRHTPDACRLIMIDPKMLELSVYEGIPHLLTPVVTDPKKAIIALKWAVKEMEDRYRKMARLAVRNIDGYNARMAEAREKGEIITRQVQVGFDKESGEALYEEQQMDLSALPYIVIIVDEMADLMMVAGKEIEGAIQRLAQMARAAGIHLVMATQRPSVDVITGTIKANFPTRISFQVTSKIDSRTILGEMGAETLLGQGDMLFMAGGGRITRVHGPFVSDGEVEHVVAFLKAQGGPEYLEDVVQDEEAEGPGGSDDAVFDKGELGESGGDLYEQAVAIVMRDRKASTSYIQRRLQVGYNKAASLMERMETEGIVGAANHAGKREILSFGRDRDDDR